MRSKHVLRTVTGILLGAATTLWSQPAQTTAILAGKLFDPKSGQMLANRVVLIQGERITSVGPDASVPIPAVRRVHRGAQILLNAASCLAIADSELAAAWLRQARALEPENFAVVGALGQLYARVIIGLASPGPDLLPTAIDPSLANSPFAQRLARSESPRGLRCAAPRV